MKVKRLFVFGTGLAIGYVAGTAAGRERYEQIRHRAIALASELGFVDGAGRPVNREQSDK